MCKKLNSIKECHSIRKALLRINDDLDILYYIKIMFISDLSYNCIQFFSETL